MTDDAIILETLKFINRETRYNPFVNINTTIWQGYDIRKQEALRRLLFKKELVNQNMNNQWEFRLTSKGDLAIESGDEELKRDFLKFISKQPDIELFMKNHFIKPDPTNPHITNETDEGVIFVNKLKGEGLIEFDKGALSHVNFWHIDVESQKKRWFDTLHEPLLVSLTKDGYRLLADFPIKSPINIQTTSQIKKSKSGTWPVRVFNKIIDNALVIVTGVIGTVLGGLLLIMILNYLLGKGFTL